MRSMSARQPQGLMLSYFPRMPYRAPGAPERSRPKVLSGKPIRYYRPKGSQDLRRLVDEGFQAFNAARLSEACAIFTEKMLAPDQNTTIGLTMAGALPRAGLTGVPIYTSSPGDSSIGMNIAYHELMNGGRLMIDPNKDVNEVCAIVLAGARNGCVILGGGSPKNFYLQAQPTLWEVYGIPKGGNEYFIQITTDSVVWGGLSGATPAEAVSWGKVNPGVLPDTVVAYCDSTIAFPLFCEYAIGSQNGRRPLKQLVHKRAGLLADLKRQATAARDKQAATELEPAEIDRHR